MWQCQYRPFKIGVECLHEECKPITRVNEYPVCETVEQAMSDSFYTVYLDTREQASLMHDILVDAVEKIEASGECVPELVQYATGLRDALREALEG